MAQQAPSSSRRGHASTSSVGSFDAHGPPPARPERSQRRPVGQGASPSPAVARGPNETGRFEGANGAASRVPAIGVSGDTSGTAGGQGKNQRMIDQLRGYGGAGDYGDSPNLGASTSSSIHFAPRLSPVPGGASPTFDTPRQGHDDDASSTASSPTSSRAGSPSRRPSATGSTRPDPRDSPPLIVPAALQNAVSAFSNAGRRRADERRGGLADQGLNGSGGIRKTSAAPSLPDGEGQTDVDAPAAMKRVLNPDDYPDTPAFRQVDEVLRRCRDEWPNLVRGTSLAPTSDQGDEGGLVFDPVSLALELLEPERAAGRNTNRSDSGSRQNLTSFLRLKSELDGAIKSTLSPRMNPPVDPSGSKDAYRAFETAITTHNATLTTLTSAQKLVGGMRTGLVGTREKLEGQGKEGLAGMYARLGMLEEMGSLLDEMCVVLCCLRLGGLQWERRLI